MTTAPKTASYIKGWPRLAEGQDVTLCVRRKVALTLHYPTPRAGVGHVETVYWHKGSQVVAKVARDNGWNLDVVFASGTRAYGLLGRDFEFTVPTRPQDQDSPARGDAGAEADAASPDSPSFLIQVPGCACYWSCDDCWTDCLFYARLFPSRAEANALIAQEGWDEVVVVPAAKTPTLQRL